MLDVWIGKDQSISIDENQEQHKTSNQHTLQAMVHQSLEFEWLHCLQHHILLDSVAMTETETITAPQ